MSSSTLRVIAILLALGAIILGYMGYRTSQIAVQTDQISPQAEPEPQKVPVLVAAKDIAADQYIELEDVTTLLVESSPPDSFQRFEALTGRQLKLPIAAGEMVLKDHFHNFSSLVSSIRPGERAIAVRVDEVTGAGGFIEPGDSVDVLLYLAAGHETGKDSSAQRILSDVRVLAYGNSVDDTDADAIKRKATLNKTAPAMTSEATSEQAEKKDEASGKKSKTAVLAVAETALSNLLLAESAGRLRLALIGKQSGPQTPQETVSDKAKRQLVTLDQYKPVADMPPQTVTEAAPKQAYSPPTPASVTIHRGTQQSTISVAREN